MVIKMNKRNFLIIISTLIVIFGVLLTVVIIHNNKEDTKDKLPNKEYLEYSNYYNLELVEEENEPSYYILGLTTLGQNETSITIPDTIDNIKVTKLLSVDKQFVDYRKIKEIKLGKYINYIGSMKNDTSLGTDIFEGALSLTRIIVDSNNETYASLNGILYNKNKDVLLKFPNSLSLPENKTVKLIDSVKVIYNKAFINNSTIEKLELNNNIEKIGNLSFKNCSNLNEIKFSSSSNLKEIGNEAFYDCNKLTIVDLPLGVMKLGNNCFAKCEMLTSISLPKTFDIVNSGNNICLITYLNPNFKIYCDALIIDEVKANYHKLGIKTEIEMNNIIKER